MPTVLKYGMFGSFAIIIFSLLSTILIDPTSLRGILTLVVTSTIAAVVIYFLFSFLAIKRQRDIYQDGYISWGNAFIVGFLTIIIIVLIGTLFSFIYHNIIDPGYYTAMAEGLREILEEKGQEDAMIEQTVNDVKDLSSPNKLIRSVLYGTAFGAVLSAIAAAILQKKQDNNILA